MKTKIVLWGENEKGEKILLGIELIAADNIIRIHQFPEKDATEIFYNQMMNQWRQGQTIPLPESTVVIDRPLSMSDSLLPDEIKTDRQDVLVRAKTEWHFVVLSAKLYQAYIDEITQIRERIADLAEFDSAIWEEMKGFWEKVQTQVREKNLFREHASDLRNKTNEIFDALKSLKKAANDEFERLSRENVQKFVGKLEDIEERIEKGLGLQPIFNELKDLQNVFKNTSFTRKHHNDVWKRLDGAFKKIKEKKYGKPQPGMSNALNRLTRRYEGLIAAIGKMEQSIKRDIKDKNFQERRINDTEGQLELQIRQAKMIMIEERVNSKQAKLDDMLTTKAELEKKIQNEKQKLEEQKKEETNKPEGNEANEEVKEESASEDLKQQEEVKEREEAVEKTGLMAGSVIGQKNEAEISNGTDDVSSSSEEE